MSSNDSPHPQKGSFHGRRHSPLSRYRVFGQKRCVTEGKAAQGAKIRSRYRVFSSKGCVAAGVRFYFSKPVRDTEFLAGKGVSRKEKQLKVRKSARDTGSSAQKGVSLQGFASIFLNLFAIQSFWPEKVCHGRKSSSRCENLFAIQGLQLKRVYRCKGSPLFF